MNKKSVLLILAVVFAISCQKITFFPDADLNLISAKIAHRGGANHSFRENTLEACIAALDSNDGVEVDIQISKDRTLWLDHNSRIKLCNGSEICFPETEDDVIESLDSCNGKDISYTQFEQLVKFMAQNHPSKYLLVDLKGWLPCSANGLDIEGLMRLEVEKIIAIGERHNFTNNMHLETDALSVLQWAKKKSNKLNTYLNVYGDAERGMLFALNYNLTGIAFKLHAREDFTQNHIDLMHKKGKRVIIWNTSNRTEMEHYISIGADFVEYDLF